MVEVGTCPSCGCLTDTEALFCGNCGAKTVITEIVSVEPPVQSDKKLLEGLKSQFKEIGIKAQQVSSEITSSETATGVVSKAKEATRKAGTMVSPERATEVVQNIINLMLEVASEVRKEVPAHMRKAIDLSAEANFVAFTIGVSIDLDQLEAKPKVTKTDVLSKSDGYPQLEEPQLDETPNVQKTGNKENNNLNQ